MRVDEVRASLAKHGERYLERTYTEGERRECGSDPRRLAARFAAKEAVVKALGGADGALPWDSIGAERDESGRLCVRLGGPAAALARSRGARRLELSLTHRNEVALAVVLVEIMSDEDD